VLPSSKSRDDCRAGESYVKPFNQAMGPKASASPAQKMSAQLQAAAGTGSVQKVAQAIKKGARADILSPKEPYSAVIASVRYCLKHRDSAAALEVNQARPCQTCFAGWRLVAGREAHPDERHWRRSERARC
jgi:hypothetical protein